jgi:hypothetical protein
MNTHGNWPSMTKVALLFSFAFFSIPMVAGSVATADCSSLAIPRVTENVNDVVRTPLRGGLHPLARAEFDRGSVDDSLPMAAHHPNAPAQPRAGTGSDDAYRPDAQ